mmetsp:Transcript_2347/g.8672  ORF Transcript_2347/g.8672 Transcript_2347/m.8672 type:complete len:271 (-) Transcript_2347:71-883(-)
MHVCPSTLASTSSLPFSTSYAACDAVSVLCTVNPKFSFSRSPSTATKAVSFIVKSSRSFKRYCTFTGRRPANASHGAHFTKSAAAPNKDAPNSGVNPSTDSMSPGKCCVPQFASSGAYFGSICPRITASIISFGTGANAHRSIPSFANPSLHPSTYAHPSKLSHLSFSPTNARAVDVHATRTSFGAALALFLSCALLEFNTCGAAITFDTKSTTSSHVGGSGPANTFPRSPASCAQLKNAPSVVLVINTKYGLVGNSVRSSGNHARSLWT